MPIPHHLKTVVSNLPESPGIYMFYDDKQRLLYIGKSKNLKSRVRTYFRKQSEDVQDRTLIMINNIHNIIIEQTNTELEALILEDRLIKQFLPPYNVKQKKFKEQVYIAVTSDRYPALKIVKNIELDLFTKIYGPFKDKYAAEFIMSILSKILKLRYCSDPTPRNKCMLAGIGKCLGPCQKDISPIEYLEVIKIALVFLKGSSKQFSLIIQDQIEFAAKNLDFEEAAKLRDINEFCQNFCIRQHFTTRIIEQDSIIFGKKNTFLFRNCSLLKVYRNKVSIEQAGKYFSKMKPAAKENIQFLIDRAYVVWVWVKQNNAAYEFMN